MGFRRPARCGVLAGGGGADWACAEAVRGVIGLGVEARKWGQARVAWGEARGSGGVGVGGGTGREGDAGRRWAGVEARGWALWGRSEAQARRDAEVGRGARREGARVWG
ncbi:hypothetical protein GCM10009850_054060 [Nonomuraea monospora]|uniref:Uncharacterized protein n=1 Tax=Nonomuraea monospora TaxID=568818 RepID=A0ABN3CKN8_9ACTN